MPSTIWSGNIAFGLVSVPIKVVAATRSLDVSFHQLDGETNARIRNRRVSEATGEEVPRERIVKGREIEPGRYVIVDDKELRSLAPKASHTIEVEDFVDLDQIDPVYFEQPYYLVPDATAAAKPYQLLVATMTELDKVAIGRLVMRSKERLVAIRPLEGILCLETMRYVDEVLPAAEAADPKAAPTTNEEEDDAEPSDRELEMARQLVETLTVNFEPGKYHDEYRQQLESLIDRKAAGEEIVAEPVPEEHGEVLDLTEALEASLAARRSA